MKLLICLILLVFTVSAHGQKADLAIPTYTKNDKLIRLTNLSGLSDCSTRTIMGKVTGVDVNGEIAQVSLREKKESNKFEVPLDRLSADIRGVIFKQLLKKKIRLRVAGYSCSVESPIAAFSIDRIY